MWLQMYRSFDPHILMSQLGVSRIIEQKLPGFLASEETPVGRKQFPGAPAYIKHRHLPPRMNTLHEWTPK